MDEPRTAAGRDPNMNYEMRDQMLDVVRAARAEVAEPGDDLRAIGREAARHWNVALRDALEQARDRMQTMFDHMTPDRKPEDLERVAQECWFGMEEIDRVLGMNERK